LNSPDFYPYLNPQQWWSSFNNNWLKKAVDRGDDIYLATEINYTKLWDASNSWPNPYAYEVRYLIQRGHKPINLSISEWENAKTIITQIFK
jgi:hypothetical protein